jgi:hypothetical protein
MAEPFAPIVVMAGKFDEYSQAFAFGPLSTTPCQGSISTNGVAPWDSAASANDAGKLLPQYS